MDTLIEKVRLLHIKNNFKENGGEDKLFRMVLIMEELGEICSSITKDDGNFEEEHADLLILLLGNCVAYNIDILRLASQKLDRLLNLSPQSIDCIVFWTKNALPLMPYLDELDDRGYRYIFQYTFTPYSTDIERNLTSKDSILKNMTDLATRIGKNRLIWRYDPICLNEKYSVDFHITRFGTLCQNLHRDVHHAVISFMDSYRKNGTTSLMGPDEEQARYLCSEFGRIAARHQIEIKTCCESWNLEEFGIGQGACIDEVLLNQVCRYPLNLKKAKGQRAGCLCRESIDIGTYNTCTNGCIYCYATDSRRLKKTIGSYLPDSPLLCGTVNGLGNGAHHQNQGRDLFQ